MENTTDVEFNIKIIFYVENYHGAKIYKDPMNRYAVKVKDHPFAMKIAPLVSYQGDRYIGKKGILYLVVEEPLEVDQFGVPVTKRPPVVGEVPPKSPHPDYRLVNSVRAKRVETNDLTIVLYH